MLNTYYAAAAPLITRQFGGEVEKFMGDGMMATFNGRGDQPDHAVRAAGAALALQRELTAIAEANPGWPRLRVGVNSGLASVREVGGDGFVAYVVVGDTVNTASRLESEAPEGGVLIGADTRRALPDGTSSRRCRDCASRAGRRRSTRTSCARCRARPERTARSDRKSVLLNGRWRGWHSQLTLCCPASRQCDWA